MSLKVKQVAWAVGAALALAFSAQAGAQTLGETVDKTLKTSPDVLVSVAQRLAAEEGVGVARGGFNPKVDVLLGYGRQGSDTSSTRSMGDDTVWLKRREAQLTVSQMLFDGFGVSSDVDRTKAIHESAGYALAGGAEKVALNVVESYLEVLRLRELVNVTTESLKAHERVYEQIKMRATGGVSRKSDQDQIEARLALAKANMLAAQANLRDAETTFLRVTGARPQTLSKPEPPTLQMLPKTPDEAVTQAVENHPILKSAESDVVQADAQHRAYKSSMYPRLDLELGAVRNDNVDGIKGDNNSTYAMLRLRYNLFRGFADQSKSAQTKQQYYEATEIMHRARRQAEEAVLLSYAAFESSRERLPALRQHADSSNLTREAYLKQFALGQRTLLDVLDSENEYFTATTNYINGTYVEMFARYRILADIGNLVDALGVERPEEGLYVREREEKQAAAAPQN